MRSPLLFTILLLYSIRIISKEIIIQDYANSQKQFCINTLSLEYIVHVCTIAKEFSCEPTNRTFLPTKFLFNEFSNVKHKNKNGRNHSVLISELRYRQAPCSKISTNNSHPNGYEPSLAYSQLLLFGGFQFMRIRAKAQISSLNMNGNAFPIVHYFVANLRFLLHYSII